MYHRLCLCASSFAVRLHCGTWLMGGTSLLPSACASELYSGTLWRPGLGCCFLIPLPLLLRCHSGPAAMGQTQGSPPSLDALVEALARLPPSWLQLLRQALDQVERDQGGTWTATSSSWSSSTWQPTAQPSAAPPEPRVVTRVRRSDIPCGIPCTSCLTGYCSRNKRGHNHHNCTACERSGR